MCIIAKATVWKYMKCGNIDWYLAVLLGGRIAVIEFHVYPCTARGGYSYTETYQEMGADITVHVYTGTPYS